MKNRVWLVTSKAALFYWNMPVTDGNQKTAFLDSFPLENLSKTAKW